MIIDVADVPTKRWTVRAITVAKRLMTTTTPKEGQEWRSIILPARKCRNANLVEQEWFRPCRPC